MLLAALTLIIGTICIIAISNALFWPRVKETAKVYSQVVSVLIPARNEEQNLPACLDTLLAQPEAIAEILVYDDHSVDGTRALIQTYAGQHSLLKLVPSSPLSPGWCGKTYACAQLAKAARGQWLLWLDADARLTANAINRMLAAAEARQLTLLSCWPRFAMESWGEKILMPMLNFVVFSIYPSWLAQKPELRRQAGLGLAHGACMLFDRASYEAFGGHERVKAQIFEDTRLAQLWRVSGRNGLCLDGQAIVWVRMYTTWRGIWYGFQKNFYPAFVHETSFWLFLWAHLVLFLSPFLGAVFFPHRAWFLAAGLVWLTRMVLALRFRHSLLSVLFHPVAEGVLLCLGISSWWKYRRGQGVAWKGRVYPRGA
ncbi:MAG: glycosyltransferase family 2 protein [Blastocatellia bacterium]